MSDLPLRVAFVGQGVYFRLCALEAPTDGLAPAYVDFRAGASPARLLAQLAAIDPDVVLVFRPEIVPAGLLDGLRAVTLGYLTEPLPRAGGARHADLQARLRWLEEVDAGNFDRILSFDPLIAETAGSVVAVWRSLPLPVADSVYMEPPRRTDPPRIAFIGRSTEHREQLLAPAKARHRLVHIGHGLHGQELLALLRETDVQLNLHNNPYPTFENRVSMAMAAGHLVISEPLSPSHGLQSARDYLEVTTPAELLAILDELARQGDAHIQVQAAGREQAERFRASRVYPELLRDALADIDIHGTARRGR